MQGVAVVHPTDKGALAQKRANAVNRHYRQNRHDNTQNKYALQNAHYRAE